MSADERPALPHLTSEFLLWLWYASERDQGRLELGGDEGSVDYWVDQRLAFRTPDEDKAKAVLTGDNPSATLEARAALAGGKIVQDLRLGLRRQGREYSLNLKGVHLDVAGAKLPTECKGGEDEVLYERMFLYEDLWFVVKCLYRRFASERASSDWAAEHLPAMRAWARGGGAAEPDDLDGV